MSEIIWIYILFLIGLIGSIGILYLVFRIFTNRIKFKCPNCKSKKIIYDEYENLCRDCLFTWTYTSRGEVLEIS